MYKSLKTLSIARPIWDFGFDAGTDIREQYYSDIDLSANVLTECGYQIYVTKILFVMEAGHLTF